MNWNAPPPDFPNKQFGYVTPEEQAEYAVLAYKRAQEEWPWVGVVTAWFFKRATDTEADQPMYYFRLVEPDFTPLPVYDALKEHTSQPPVLYPGVAQEDHWALTYSGPWEPIDDTDAELGAYLKSAGPDAAYLKSAGPDAALSFTFDGTDLWLNTGPDAAGSLSLAMDGGAEETFSYEPGESLHLAASLPKGAHTAAIRPSGGTICVDSLSVEARPALQTWLIAAGAIIAFILLTGAAIALAIRLTRPARRWYEHDRGR
jgi:hypothetical protein